MSITNGCSPIQKYLTKRKYNCLDPCGGRALESGVEIGQLRSGQRPRFSLRESNLAEVLETC